MNVCQSNMPVWYVVSFVTYMRNQYKCILVKHYNIAGLLVNIHNMLHGLCNNTQHKNIYVFIYNYTDYKKGKSLVYFLIFNSNISIKILPSYYFL